MCNHKLNKVKALFASGQLKYQCQECDAIVYREHPKAVFPWRILFIDRIGLLFFAIVFVVFAHLPLAVAVFLALSIVLYLIDVALEPLKVYTEEQAREQGKKNSIALVVVLVVFGLSIGAYLWQP